MSAVDFSRLAVAVATHYRPEGLRACVRDLVETLPDYRQMQVIVNHPDGACEFEVPQKCSVLHSGRPPEHIGCMAKTWNLAMLWAFRDPEVDWLLCAMDDARLAPGWPALLNQRDADLYLAPAGDLVFLFNRKVLQTVGWFDERFVVTGYQEWDWQARAARALGTDRLCIQDDHGWTVNPVGLSGHWQHDTVLSIRTQRPLHVQHVNRVWLERKWGCGTSNDFFYQAISGGGPREPEIDWYPWFDRRGAVS